MARNIFRRRRAPVVRDDFGGGPDGSLAIRDTAEERALHTTPARVAASLRYLVARVRLHDEDGFPPCLAITSALKGEGVTYVSRSLASVIAYDTDASVVVVDLNWRAPPKADKGGRFRRALGGGTAAPAEPAAAAPEPAAAEPVPAEPAPDESAVDATATGEPIDATPGDATDDIAEPDPVDEVTRSRKTLIDAVNGDASLDDIVSTTSNPRLTLVTAGEAEFARRPGLAGDPRLAAVLHELGQRFDHVLLDLPPVLASSEAMILAERADAFILVVRQGLTTEQQVDAALEELQGSEALGVVLNRVDSSVPKRLRRLLGV